MAKKKKEKEKEKRRKKKGKGKKKEEKRDFSFVPQGPQSVPVDVPSLCHCPVYVVVAAVPMPDFSLSR